MPGKKRVRNGLNGRFRAAAGRWAKLVELALFPTRCKTCGRLLDAADGRVLCRPCLDEIVPSRLTSCPRCGRFFAGAGEAHLCASCLSDPPAFAVHRSSGGYRGRLKDALLLFKYRKYKPLGRELALFVHETKNKDNALWDGVDLIVPVPLHVRRARERGFNQSAVLAREIGRLRGIPVETRALRKIRNAPPQTSLERAGRLANIRGAYRAVHPERVRGRTLMLVDDVYTTGATLRECAAVLDAAGAKEVRAITVAQA
jgi:competence protein ComFC